MGEERFDQLSRRDLLRTVAIAPVASAGPVADRRQRSQRVTLISSASVSDGANAVSGTSFRSEEFGIVGIFDVDWFRTPQFRRMFDYISASPDIIQAVRVFGVLNSGTKENTTPSGSGTVWPEACDSIDFSTTFDALEETHVQRAYAVYRPEFLPRGDFGLADRAARIVWALTASDSAVLYRVGRRFAVR